MSNLPILSNNTAFTNKTNNSSNANTKMNDGASQNTQPFGEVLARQLSEKTSLDVKSLIDAKGDAKPLDATVSDGANVAASDPINIESGVDTVAVNLSTDILATLLPQTVAVAVAALNIPTQSTVSDDKGAITCDKLKGAMISSDLTVPVKDVKDASDPAELTASKIALKPQTSFTTSQDPAKIGADVAVFAKAIELRDKLDIALAAPLTQGITPPANLVQSMAGVSPVTVQLTQMTIDTPVTQRQWGNDFSQKITWMATQQQQYAELHLNPAQLGPVEVLIKVNGDQATAQFTSAHAAVRDVIEQSIPKLREMLADNGIMLGNATVSDQAPRDQRGEFGNQRQTAPNGRLLESVPANMSDTRVVTPLNRHNGMVDTFA
jgi:flagellar hook-length control protein FliK